MRIKFRIAHGVWVKGNEADLPEATCRRLIAEGRADAVEAVQAAPAATAPKAAASPIDKMHRGRKAVRKAAAAR